MSYTSNVFWTLALLVTGLTVAGTDRSENTVTDPSRSVLSGEGNLTTASPMLPAATDGVVRGIVPLYGFEEGAVLIEGDEWLRVSKTVYSTFENVMRSEGISMPVLSGTTREYYLGFRKADNINSCAGGSEWRLFFTWWGQPGHSFTVGRNWGHPAQGRIQWKQLPSISDQVTAAGGDPRSQNRYWRLEARIPSSCVSTGKKMKVYGIWLMVVDREGGSTPTVNLDGTLSGGSGAVHTIGGYGGGKIHVHPSGSVGIGTADEPGDFKLAVEGKVGAHEVVVQTESWADFVFEEDYDLPSLSAVKNHIDQEGHLPSFPSAEEVKRDGIAVGTMQRQLLQKIEELTLYLIDQDERLRRQQAHINDLQAQLGVSPITVQH